MTHSIIGCAFEVINELGSGFLESVYEKAMLQALADAGIFVEAQKPVKVQFRGKTIGNFYVDLLIERNVLVELKAVKAPGQTHTFGFCCRRQETNRKTPPVMLANASIQSNNSA